jgi:two-component system alkaline phosphatase synthesis response regulator PhoP
MEQLRESSKLLHPEVISVTRENILEKVWGDDVLVVDRTIDVHIRKIREKLGEEMISTIKGVGYKFEG